MNPLYVAWHTEKPSPTWGPVGRLDLVDGLYRFIYTRGATTLAGFQPFEGMPKLDQVYESHELFPLFKNRLLSASRPEFNDYLTWSDFDPDDPPEPLMLLARTEGIKRTDPIELFPCPHPDSHGCFINFFFVHGIRYHLPNAGPVLGQLTAGDRLELRPQPQNRADQNALAIFANDVPLGYVPRYLAADTKRLIKECPNEEVRLFVQRVNPGAPMQQRLLCRLEACWPTEFLPCQGPEFELMVTPADVG